MRLLPPLSGRYYHTERRNIREGSHLHTRRRENLKSHQMKVIFSKKNIATYRFVGCEESLVQRHTRWSDLRGLQAASPLSLYRLLYTNLSAKELHWGSILYVLTYKTGPYGWHATTKEGLPIDCAANPFHCPCNECFSVQTETPGKRGTTVPSCHGITAFRVICNIPTIMNNKFQEEFNTPTSLQSVYKC
jgi:hypothetical protein